MEEEYFWYEISHTDSREGKLVQCTIAAKDEGEAIDLASEDYYFHRLVDIYEGGPASKEEYDAQIY